MSTSTAELITSLLNTLHSHLHSQSALLPALIHQLGLPSSALQSELDTLRTNLVASVDAQVDVRRRQVDEWMDKCDGVEKLCVRYSNALGGNIKSAGSTVGEIGKEQVLPRRYELAIEFQEKLRQLYHTKLEHLTSLSNRLANLSRILGSGFYSAEITELAIAPGASADNESSSNPIRDVTPERFMKLEKELVRGKAEVSKRLTQLSETFVQIDWLYAELGMLPPYTMEDSEPGPPPKYDDDGGGESRCSFLSSSDDLFATSTPTPATRVQNSTVNRKRGDLLFLAEADTPPPPVLAKRNDSTSEEYERIFARFVFSMSREDADQKPPSLDNLGIDPTPGLLTWAAQLQQHLTDIKRHREAHIQTLYDQLEALWRRCGADVISDEGMDQFVERNRGSTEEVVHAYETEVERMMEVKRERMGLFVESAREEIKKLWADLMTGEEETGAFAAMQDDEHTEELLSIHEDEIKRLKEEKKIKAPILGSVKKYFEICDEEQELALAASDQTRLLGRGRSDPGRLLREEKMRRRVNKEKPRLEQDLLSSIPIWERETGIEFLVYGQSILALLRETVGIPTEPENQIKQRKPPAGRAGSQPPLISLNTTRSGTLHMRSISGGSLGSRHPANSQAPVTGTKRSAPPSTMGTGTVTPAVRPRSAMAMASNKRPRIDIEQEAVPPLPSTAATARRGPAAGTAGRSRAASPSKIPASAGVRTVSSAKPPSSGSSSSSASVAKPTATASVLGPGAYNFNSRSAGGGGKSAAIGMGVPSAMKKGGAGPFSVVPAASTSVSKGSTIQSIQSRLQQSQSQQPLSASTIRPAQRSQRQHPQRESFKPRPSSDYDDLAGITNPRWYTGAAGSAPGRVDEEDEDDY